MAGQWVADSEVAQFMKDHVGAQIGVHNAFEKTTWIVTEGDAPPPSPTTDVAQWVANEEVEAFLAKHEGWLVGAVDKQRNVTWVAPKDWAPTDNLNTPWPGRPANEVPRAKYRTDGTCKSSGYLPSGAYVEAQPPATWTCPLCHGSGQLGPYE